METTLKKWGNSLAIRIPGAYCRQSGMVEGSKVTVSIENGSLVITPVKGKYELEELLLQVNDDNLHGEIQYGEPKGREIW
jgi:antitoxin MazE